MTKRETPDPELVKNGEWRLSAIEKLRFNIFHRELWYDWWCDTKWLQVKGEKLMNAVLDIVNSPKFDKRETYVFFKNNCPMVGKLYDDFRICDINTYKVLYTVSNRNRKWQVYCEGHWGEPIVEGSWKKVKEWFMN